jgi:hypothetical protein
VALECGHDLLGILMRARDALRWQRHTSISQTKRSRSAM